MGTLTLSQFKAEAEWTDDPAADYPGYGFDDREVGAGMVYTGPDGGFALIIEAVDTLDDRYMVELFGDDFAGTLADCEAELWHAARNEGVFK